MKHWDNSADLSPPRIGGQVSQVTGICTYHCYFQSLQELSSCPFLMPTHTSSNASLMAPPTMTQPVVRLSGPFPPPPLAANQPGTKSQGTEFHTPLPGSLQRPLPLPAMTVETTPRSKRPLPARTPCQNPEMVTTPLPQLAGRRGTGQMTPSGDILDLLASDVPPTPFQHANFDLEMESPSPVLFMNDHKECDSK